MKSADTDWRLWQALVISIVVVVSSLISTLECGLVWAALTLVVVLPALHQLHKNQAGKFPIIGFAAIWICVLALPVWLINGLGDVCLRPISWLWLRPPIELLPSMTPTWRMADFDWANLLLLLLLLEYWRQALWGRVRLPDVLLLMSLTVIALGCARYSWIAVATIFMCFRPTRVSEVTEGSNSDPFKIERLLAALGATAFMFQLFGSASTILAADLINRRLDVGQWNVSGTVMLTNLEHAPAWQRASLRSGTVQYQYQPILTDRWDRYHSDYPRYAAICTDWKDWKREAYLRQDGEWGGYQAVFDEWQPELVVVDSRDLPGIHRVSLDSHWKVIGIDARKTVFAHSQADSTQQYVAYANRSLQTLEFPRPISDVDFERVVALGNPSDARRVSAVLTSLRLPFAGLRVLPSAADRQTQTCAAVAYAELAHRSHRYSGTYSLLDNARALGGTVKLAGERQIVDVAETYLANLHRQIDESPASVSQLRSREEQAVRDAIIAGQQPRLDRLSIEGENSAAAEFYATLASAFQQPAPELLQKLQAVPRSDLSAALAAECSFYIGCLANEVGDVALAQNALAESLAGDAASPFASIAKFYLSQITP